MKTDFKSNSLVQGCLLFVFVLVSALYLLKGTDLNNHKANKMKLDYSHKISANSNQWNQYLHNTVINSSQSLSQTDVQLIDGLLNKSTKSHKVRIPHIIHQIWDTFQIPQLFVKNVISLNELHPDWEYWFWTERAMNCFMKKNYFKYFALFDAYPDATSRADAARIFIIHKFGGFYIDLDTICLKSLNIWSQKFCCVFSEEPYEHSFIVREQTSNNIVNSPMACQQSHQFFENAIKQLPEYAERYLGDHMKSTGPEFLHSVYTSYKTKNSKQGNCLITVLPPKYFLPQFDQSQMNIVKQRCSITNLEFLTPNQKSVCANFWKSNRTVDRKSAFMDHKWSHVAFMGSDWKQSNTVSLFTILPKAKNLEHFFCG